MNNESKRRNLCNWDTDSWWHEQILYSYNGIQYIETYLFYTVDSHWNFLMCKIELLILYF